ncbi:hypothetical protein FG386_002292 [Cryptosporidium ryanae]|uniref:uncharacterized protein n=1 Tax=Cryptosporidium ryanae TaxID=515981 RepID=UPI00351A0130|nr:hypothetical protein FG386_002292 [Cryptosporidium ryanae]
MIEPASAFCIGVYFLGVGVVSSVLYIPISLMKAIEHYNIGRDVRRINDNSGDNSNNDYLLEDEIIGVSSKMNNLKKEEYNCNDSNISSHDKPELLLIYKKKLLRNMLNDNNYLTNLNLDDESDVYSNSGCYSDSGINVNNKKSPRHNDCYLSLCNHDFNANTDNTTSNALLSGDGGEINILVENEDSIFHLDYFNNIQMVKNNNKTKLTSSNSTYSLISSLDTSSTINRYTSKYSDNNAVNRVDSDVNLYESQQYLSVYDNESKYSYSNRSFNSLKQMSKNKLNKYVYSFITEISEAYDVLAP